MVGIFQMLDENDIDVNIYLDATGVGKMVGSK